MRASGEFDAQSSSRNAIALALTVRSIAQRKVFVQERAHVGDHLGAATRVIATGARATVLLGNDIGAVERIVQTAPPGIGRVQGIASVVHRHHQLWAGDVCDLIVNILRLDPEGLARRLQVADLLQECPIGPRIETRTRVSLVPLINLCLELVATLQQLRVTRSQLAHETVKSAPEVFLSEAGARQCFLIDEVIQDAGNLEFALGNAILGNAITHGNSVLGILSLWEGCE